MDDQELVNRINELAQQEHRLEEAHVGQGLAPEEEERLRTIEVALDQCWDLLRQRRAGFGPTTAEADAASAGACW